MELTKKFSDLDVKIYNKVNDLSNNMDRLSNEWNSNKKEYLGKKTLHESKINTKILDVEFDNLREYYFNTKDNFNIDAVHNFNTGLNKHFEVLYEWSGISNNLKKVIKQYWALYKKLCNIVNDYNTLQTTQNNIPRIKSKIEKKITEYDKSKGDKIAIQKLIQELENV
jgi:hypothetical protein